MLLDSLLILVLVCRYRGLEWHRNAKDVPLGEKRKRGKSVTTKKALMIQPTEFQLRDYVRNQNKLLEALVNSILSQVDVMG
ncbi:hypothetical protein BpHYR1_004676 [Brachionus plicatilis]|uniref:Uncharacterized protein n=1 Tax=Brachionus plicatilis TaxID=10195 RepID=A0A3M7RZS7_BRAPC|nr:hypothetical protein BpHYR1_004676 [Brachionus plicatilis]